MNLQELPGRIKHLNYVVQRNWEGLPTDMGGDLDLFVSNEDFDELSKIIDEFDHPELVDIRQPGDGYYPMGICWKLLRGCRWHWGWKIPSAEVHFISLYYHSHVHKLNNPYDKKLRQIFLEAFPPTKPDDNGVTYNP